MQFLYLGGLVVASADIIPQITGRIRLAWVCYKGAELGVVRHEGCRVYLKSAHAKGRGTEGPAVRVRGTDS